MEIAFSSSFKRAFRKKIKGNAVLETEFWNRVEIFITNPHDVFLRTHKLTGKLKDLWSFSITFDLRVVFFFEDNNRKAIFIDFGSHEEVY